MENKLLIGEILKPQGIRGEVKVKPYGNDATRFLQIKELLVGGVLYKVLNARVSQDFVYLSLKNIGDRNLAETLRGKLLEIERVVAPTLPSGEYYVIDVLGCVLLDEMGKRYGEIIDIRTGLKDIYTVKTENDKNLIFPLLKDLLIEISIERKEVVVSSSRLQEVSFYEN